MRSLTLAGRVYPIKKSTCIITCLSQYQSFTNGVGSHFSSKIPDWMLSLALQNKSHLLTWHKTDDLILLVAIIFPTKFGTYPFSLRCCIIRCSTWLKGKLLSSNLDAVIWEMCVNTHLEWPDQSVPITHVVCHLRRLDLFIVSWMHVSGRALDSLERCAGHNYVLSRLNTQHVDIFPPSPWTLPFDIIIRMACDTLLFAWCSMRKQIDS